MVSFISIVMSTIIADSSSGKASAINVSGSLRMMSFRLLSEIQQPAKHPQTSATIEQFEHRLALLERLTGQPPLIEVTESLRLIRQHWQEVIRPLTQSAIDPISPKQSEAAIQLAQDIPGFVSQIDEVVLLIEQDLEKRIRFLRATQFALLAISLFISAVTIWMLRQQLVMPLAELLKAARTITGGSFTTRVQHTGPDELGALGQAFNAMMDEISRMYGSLEEMVDEKTKALTRTNQSLELLYRTSQQLSSADLSLDIIQQVMRDIEDALELGHSMLCISENGQLPAQRVLSNLTQQELFQLCGKQECDVCFQHTQNPAETPPLTTANGMRVRFFPVSNHEHLQARLRGSFPVVVKNDDLPREKQLIIETVGRHIANALSNMRRAEERHRLAVLEERSVIARELHDSIAQSLSYLNIQVTRLEKQLHNEVEARLVAAELKMGLNAAYRELRELITTFRLRIDERGFNSALQETVEEFSLKCGFDITVDNQLAGIVLSGNEEMHVIRIIREALTNIEKHAKATAAQISIKLDEQRQVHVSVRDNGRGFNPNTPPRNHYGLIIMRDRAIILGGDITFGPASEQGMEVCLSFKPQQFSQSKTA
jgi:two-component system, NarL family, nitrate/nitrite sensor histidine kinase NarX